MALPSLWYSHLQGGTLNFAGETRYEGSNVLLLWITTVEEIQRLLNDYQIWFNKYRAHQTLNGMTPADFAAGKRIADVVRIDDVCKMRLESVEFADGKLTGYRWVEEDKAA